MADDFNVYKVANAAHLARAAALRVGVDGNAAAAEAIGCAAAALSVTPEVRVVGGTLNVGSVGSIDKPVRITDRPDFIR